MRSSSSCARSFQSLNASGASSSFLNAQLIASWPRSLSTKRPSPPIPSTVKGKNHFCILVLLLRYRHLASAKVAAKSPLRQYLYLLLRCRFQRQLTPGCTKKIGRKMESRQRDSITILAGMRPPSSEPPGLAGLSDFNVIVTDEELRRALIGA